jgi:chromosome segregation protein
LKIRRLKLSGFKSFVEPAELRIEPGLTGVVGPNGCGKSNLFEAIRWVMGEGSPKSLRGGGMDDVIFAGTATRPPRDFAEVTMLVEREAGDGGASNDAESEVTRRIERGAGSAYRIDGRDVRAKDVSLLFADAATGAHSPALVSQGRIGAVIAAKPTERRLMLEEAAGIAGLHARRKDAEQKLRATEVNLTRLDELLSDQEARAAALRRQAKAAERYRSLSERIRAAEARLLYSRWADADRMAHEASEEAESAAGQVAELQRAMGESQAAQEQAGAVLAQRRAKAAEARDEGRILAHALATARARRDTVVRRLAELDRLDLSLAAERAREEALRDDATRAIAALEEERHAIAGRLADAEGQAARIAAELTEAEAASRAAEAALAGLLAREAAMRAERRVADAALAAATTQRDRAEAEAMKLKDQVAALADGSDAFAAQKDAKRRGVAAAAQLAESEKALEAAEKGRAAAADERDGAESELAAVRASLAAARAERTALANALSQSGGAAALAKLTVEPGYERALAAALGDDLDAGIGAEGARRWQGSEKDDADPPLVTGLEALARYVEAPPELQRRLAQIAVAEQDSGQKLSVGQRLVTRDGQLRRWDGFVATGGGAAAAERLLRANRLAELDREMPALEASVADAEQARDNAAASVDRFRAESEAARASAAAAERDAREAIRAEDSAVSALERLESQRVALAERETDLAPVREAADEALRRAGTALDNLPDPAAMGSEIEAAREAASIAGQAVADKRAEAATRARMTAADRERHAAAGREQEAWRERAANAEARLKETGQRAVAQAAEREEIAGQPERDAAEIVSIEQAGAASEAAIAAADEAEREAAAAVAQVGEALSVASEAFAAAREARAGAAARAEAQNERRAEYTRICFERFECSPPLLPARAGFDAATPTDPDVESATLERLTAERERIGPVNLVAEQELAEIDQERLRGTAERDELAQAIHRLRGSIGNLNREGRVRLLDAYEKVDRHFRSLFTTLFDGGQAHLELIESDDPLEAGLEIMAQPPGKRLSALTLLSGGEQALTAIALIFALFLTNPAPICVLDEVDAPLDDANVERFCDLLARMSAETDTRYLIVTHNAVTMSRMHRLYGVTMVEKGVSRLVSVDLGGAQTLLAAE